MKRRFTLLALALASAGLFAQSDQENPLAEMQFRNVGPAGMSGRVTTIDVDQHTNAIYVGSASGGLWRSMNEGQTWTPIFEHQSTSSIGAVAVDPTNPDVIWVGTGEGNPRNSQNSGDGIFKSIDGGETWVSMGLQATKNIHRVIIDPRDPNTVYVAAIGVAWGDTPDRGVYKTTDGGKTWRKVLYNNERTGAADLVMDPRNPNKLIVAMWEYRRWPWEFKSGGPGSGIYVTYDGGEHWDQRTSDDGLPEGLLGRCGLAISASNPEVVYALVEGEKKNALYRSDDGAQSFEKISEDDDIGNRPFYYSDIYVDPQRPNRIYSLWSVLTRSDDGGRTWKTIGPYSFIHPDHHSFWIDPQNPDHVIDGNDGGINISYDGGITWRFIENLPLAQYYHIRVDNQQPYNIYGGMQDNGSWMGPAYTWRVGGIRNDLWEELFFGDGFDVLPHPEDPNIAYAMSQEGYVGRLDLNTGYAKIIRPVHPEGEDLRFNWNAAIAQDPFDPSTIYFGSQYVHKSTNMGDSWEIISEDLTTNDPEHQKANVSGGLTYDVTGAENYTTILAIEPSPVEQGVLWVGTDDGRLHISKDGGATWTDVARKMKDFPAGAWIPQIQASANNAGEAWVVVNDYRRNNWEPYVYHTTNYGSSFKRIVGPEDVSGYALSVLSDPEEPNLMFTGTENGLYYSLNAGESWMKWGEDLPTVPVADIALQAREKDIVLGTFGRSAWVLDDIAPLRALAAEGSSVRTEPLTAFDAPTGVQAVFRRAQGLRFDASAVYKGENRSGGARISFWVNVDTSQADFKKNSKVHWDIADANGDTIRHLERDYRDGLNRSSWDMMAKGARQPSMREPRNPDNQSDPGSIPVLPGQYTLHLRIGDLHSSTMIEVQQDPRLEFSMDDLKDNYAYLQSLQPYVESMGQVTTNLRRALHSIELVKGLLEKQEDKLGDSAVAEFKEQIKTVSDSIESIRMDIFGKENVEGYYEQPHTWSSRLGTLGWFNYSNRGAVTPNTIHLADQFKSQTEAIVEKAESFFNNQWPAFQAYVDEQSLSVFRDTEPMNIGSPD